ncbi:hypothetical protein BM1_07417 [Bipolaris maydis]|uniref:uncharacterized protein n=1 Tax=Cochliobolus heterostrophus TaxID=5016 RepID=UPI0024D71EA1|nr:hypothetical protein BM1_07417 [Bipolaris maydis]KAJ5023354.1 hypothetical protein J3E73DRAFT_373666 [Bipolaris maydis]KAJ6266854.1 hypothetical protein PSV08DRAFT_355357 [Bipolaris maydis]KAJ6277472.1 hypothetical protein J3E71DRAFT_185516 [Bipolaris maydis]
MSSRTGKRPLEPRPRGDSPPSKRNRAQEPRSALPDKARSLNTTSSSSSPRVAKPVIKIPSPPPSRKTSCTSLPNNTPVVPKGTFDRNLVDSVHARRPQEKPGRPDQVSSHDAPTRSPTYLGSRPSTPTHRNAPPAPSMLPVESNSHANSTPRLDNPTNGCAPITMQSLRKLRDRRLAVAAQFSPSGMPASSATQVEVSLEAQQLEVNQLKKERNELNSRLKNVEAVFQNSNRLTNFTEQQACSSKALQPLLTRLDVLEKSLLVPKDKTFQKEKDALVPVENRLAAVEVALSNLHERLEQIKHPSNQANASLAKAANNAVTKIFASENEIPTFINDRLKKLVADKVSEYAVDIKNSIGREMAEMEAQLSKRIIDEHQLLQNTLEKLKDMKDLSATVKSIPQQLLSIRNSISGIQSVSDMARHKVKNIEQDIEVFQHHSTIIEDLKSELDKCTHFCKGLARRDLPRLEDSEESTSRRLKKLEESILDHARPDDTDGTTLSWSTKQHTAIRSVDVSNLATRIDDLERASPVISSSSVNSLAQNVEQLAKDFLNFQIAQKESKSLETKLADVNNRLESVEQVSKKFEALKEHIVLDKSFKTSLAGLDQRVSEELRIVREDSSAKLANLDQRFLEVLGVVRAELDAKLADIQLLQSSTSSETVPAKAENDDLSLMAITKALEDQVKTLQTEVDSLSDDFNETGQKLHEHSTAITLMKNQVPELFRQQFDPFKSKVQEQLGIVNGQLGAHANDIDSLKNVMSLLQTKTMSNTQALATKADADAVGTRTDSIMFALKDLEHRYQNISTDEMYQKMVHWFVQMYPASAALLRDTAQLQQDVKQLKSYCSDISWVWKRSEVLVDLCQNAGQLQWLAKNAPQLQALCRQHSPQVQGNVQQALVEVEQRLKIDINELKIMKNSLEPQMSQIAMQVADIQTSAYQHRRDFDTIKDTLIEPNKDFFGLFGTALAVLAQVQQVVEILNKSIPGSPLTLDWECYLPALVEQSKTNTNSGISAKGGNSMQ